MVLRRRRVRPAGHPISPNPLLRCSLNNGQSARGTRTSTAVPRPGFEETSNRPPSSSVRSLMDLRPTPVAGSPSSRSSHSRPGSKPTPSSSTRPRSSESSTSRITSIRSHPECATALRTASLITRYACSLARGGTAVSSPSTESLASTLGGTCDSSRLRSAAPSPSRVSSASGRASCAERSRVWSRAVLVASVARLSFSAARDGSL